jgi:hypothetical protein
MTRSPQNARELPLLLAIEALEAAVQNADAEAMVRACLQMQASVTSGPCAERALTVVKAALARLEGGAASSSPDRRLGYHAARAMA